MSMPRSVGRLPSRAAEVQVPATRDSVPDKWVGGFPALPYLLISARKTTGQETEMKWQSSIAPQRVKPRGGVVIVCAGRPDCRIGPGRWRR
jgi:hypothetical protein